MRNLTYERQLAFLERQKNQALALVAPSETVVVALAKRDKKGAVCLDEDGVPVVLDKRVLKRAFLESEHNERIATFKASGRIS